ncbi:calcium-binding protein [Thalassomonas actiniarum]|uniref:Haemolysin-type calcium binding-related domain-containing protein n=1 Tax=Thalassomonas actiniarum TaxID=485447 RepID=A0AAF0C6R3_9GAMM|nr:calcium-binding protein [Thalassomonas actiniarum]WDE02581.1 hypothetical protein SG35_029700 [Thalassomonas actiniarum]
MSLSLNTLSSENYRQLRYEWIKLFEERGHENPDIYNDGRGFPTMGVGFNLSQEFVLRAVLQTGFGIDDENLDSFYDEMSQAVTNAQDQTTAEMQRILNESWQALTQEQTATFIIQDEPGGQTAADKIEQIFETIVTREDGFEDTLTGLLANNGISNFADSAERVALLSLLYGGNELIGPNLRAAIQNGNRFDAWYEIRYASNKSGTDVENGIAKRRYAESALFGLFTNDPAPTTEAQQAVDGFINHLADIQKYENSYGHMVDAANNNLASLSAFSGLGVATVGELFKPIAGYILERFSPADGSIDLTQFAHSINGQVMLGITDGNGDIASSVKGSAGDGNDLLVAVENKSNSLSGGLGDDVLVGHNGADTLKGGAGHDILVGNSGNDKLDGGSGDDELYGGEGADELRGGEDNDTLEGGSGDDTLYGDAGDDKLYGGEGNDSLYGNGGENQLAGGEGADTYYVETGGDIIWDSDGLGKIIANNKDLSGTYNAISETEYQQEGSNVVLKLEGSILTVSGATPEGSFTVEGFQKGDLGIELSTAFEDSNENLTGVEGAAVSANLLANHTNKIGPVFMKSISIAGNTYQFPSAVSESDLAVVESGKVSTIKAQGVNSLSAAPVNLINDANNAQSSYAIEIPDVGTLYVSAGGQMNFIPEEDFYGDVPSISYIVQNTLGDESSSVLGIEIKELPEPPEPEDLPPPMVSPLVLDLDGDGIETTGFSANIYFDYGGDGFSELTGFVASDDGLLVLDRNGDGVINNGSELFGDFTPLSGGDLASHGFEALAELDSNGDGLVDVSDIGFADLRIFRDLNQNGTNDQGELFTLNELGIKSLSLGFSEQEYTDEFGNEHRQVGSYSSNTGQVMTMTDVWFNRNLSNTEYEKVEVPLEIALLPNVAGFGQVYSLHQAMVRDESGKLKQLVEQFVNASSYEERQELTESIIFAWTGQGDEYIQSSLYPWVPIDFRKIGALEAYHGYKPSPPAGRGGGYAIVHNETFDDVVNTVFFQLSARSFLQPFFSDIGWEQDIDTGEWLADYSQLILKLFEDVEANPERAQDTMSNLLQALHGVNVYSTQNRERLQVSVSDFVQIADLSNYSDETIALIVSATSDATASSDVIKGNGNDNILFALTGDDTLDGLEGNDVLDGGKGDDVLTGGSGNDEYRFGRGYGHDRIRNYDNGESRYDVVRLMGDITADDITLFHQRDDLVIIINGTAEELRVESHFDQEGGAKRYIDAIIFSDGTQLDVGPEQFDDIPVSATLVTEGPDVIHGSAKTDVFDGLAGNDEIYGQDGDDYLRGNEGHDQLYGDHGNDLLDGNSGNDLLHGGQGEDALYGGIGDDHLYGNDGNDKLYGGQGEDLLVGGLGNDDYYFNLGDGLELIDNQGSLTDIDNIHLGDGILSDNIQIRRVDNDLYITIHAGEDEIRVQNHFGDEASRISNLVFNDPSSSVTSWDATELLALANPATENDDELYGDTSANTLDGLGGNDWLYGLDGNDHLTGGAGNDRLFGGEGNDTLGGGAGSDNLDGQGGDDVYLFELGDGHDNITDYRGTNKLELGAGISLLDIQWERSGNDLKLVLPNDSITIRHWYKSEQYQLNEIHFADGLVLTGSDIKDYIQTGSELDDILLGSEGNDNFDGLGGNDKLYGYEGNDNLTGGAGNDILYGGEGDDTLRGGTGHDSLVGQEGDDVYLFELGDGNTSINDWDGFNILELGAGIKATDIQVIRQVDSLKLIMANEQITILSWFRDDKYKLSEIRFADNSVWTPADIASLMQQPTEQDDSLSGDESDNILNGLGGNDEIYGDAGNDTLIGGAGDDRLYGAVGNDILEGGTGNDTLSGMEGDDTYIFELGDGHDRLVEYYGMDRLELGEGINVNNVQLLRSGTDLKLVIGNDSITINYWFENPYSQIEEIVFADNTVWSPSDIVNLMSPGTEGADFLQGDDNDNSIDALGGDDTVYGRGGDDTLIGGSGNDRLFGDEGNDILIGSAGDDKLTDGEGNDIYRFSLGDGHDIITDYDGVDRLELGVGINPDDVELLRIGTDLKLVIGDDSITITRQLDLTFRQIEKIVFADNTVWTPAEISELLLRGTEQADNLNGGDGDDIINGLGGDDRLYGAGGDDILHGGSGNDTLSGGNDNDTLIGGTGNDKLNGMSGDDIYRFELGDGHDIILDSQGLNYLELGAGISASDVQLSYSRFDLKVDIGNDSITIENWFYNDEYRLGGIRFDDGNTWTSADISLPVQLQGTDLADTLMGDNTDNVLTGLAGEDFIFGRGGNDTLFGGEGDDELAGGIGNDILNGGSGDDELYVDDGNNTLNGDEGADELYGGEGDDTLNGGAGDDELYVYSGANTLNGGEGNDELYGGFGADTLTGGEGYDELYGGSGDDIYHFNLGDGHDIIFDHSGSNRLELAEGIRGSDIQLGRSTNNLKLIIGNDSITIGSWFRTEQSQLNEIRFADGSAWTPADIVVALPQMSEQSDVLVGEANIDILSSQGGDDLLYGEGGDDVLIGGTGNDTLYGGLGNDSYRFELGDGHDIINDHHGVNRLELGAGINKADIRLVRNNANLTLIAGNDSITIRKWFDDELYKLSEITFADGTSWSTADIDTLLAQQTGPDTTYLYNLADGHYVIDDPEGADTLRFGAGISREALKISHDGNNIIIALTAGDGSLSGDQITLVNAFTDTANRIETLVFADGSIMTADEVHAAALILTGSEEDDILNGSVYADEIYGLGGNDVIEAGEGDDELYGEAGNDTLNGGADEDELYGGTGNDILNGGVGDDELYGGDGDDALNGGAGDDELYATDGINTLSGDEGADELYGGFGDDTLNGGEGNDSLDGRIGNDTLNGGEGNDSLNGNIGNDTLNGGQGNDTYFFAPGYGQDVVEDNSGIDKLVFDVGIIQDMLNISRDGDNIIIALTAMDGSLSGDSITLNNVFANMDNRIESVEFADGSTMTANEIHAAAEAESNEPLVITQGDDVLNGTSGADVIDGLGGNDQIYGKAGDDQLQGSAGDDLIDGGAGNDVLIGNSGNNTLLGGEGDDVLKLAGNSSFSVYSNTLEGGQGNDRLEGSYAAEAYVFNIGDGQDTIYDNGGTDNIRFGIGITPDKLNIRFSGNSILIAILNDDGLATGDQILIENAFKYSAFRVESLTFFDGSTMDWEAIYQAALVVTGTEDDDNLVGSIDHDSLYGLAGNDTLTGGNGDDLLDGGTGNDILTGGSGNNILLGGDGDDVLKLAGNSSFSVYSNTLEGGQGNDRLEGSYAAETYVFNIGDGQDTIYDNGGTDSIRFGVGITPDKLNIRFSGNNILIAILNDDGLATGDQILIEKAFKYSAFRVESLIFSDGSTMDWEAIYQAALVVTGTEDDDNLVGSIDHDSLYGLAGNDTLTGGNGDDLLDGGAGNDVLTGNSGNNILYGGEGDDVLKLDGNSSFGIYANTLEGGKGNDSLLGSYAAETYVFNLGDGQDTIKDNGGIDSIRFGEGITRDRLNINVSGSADILIEILNDEGQVTGDQILIENAFKYSIYRVESLTFADGVTMDWDAIYQAALTANELDMFQIASDLSTGESITGDTLSSALNKLIQAHSTFGIKAEETGIEKSMILEAEYMAIVKEERYL